MAHHEVGKRRQNLALGKITGCPENDHGTGVREMAILPDGVGLEVILRLNVLCHENLAL